MFGFREYNYGGICGPNCVSNYFDFSSVSDAIPPVVIVKSVPCRREGECLGVDEKNPHLRCKGGEVG